MPHLSHPVNPVTMPTHTLTIRRKAPRREVRLKTADIAAELVKSDADALARLDAVALLKGTTRTAIIADLVTSTLGPRFTRRVA
jgi:hypothetical protein